MVSSSFSSVQDEEIKRQHFVVYVTNALRRADKTARSGQVMYTT